MSPTTLSVIIAGAGIGGLTSAIALRREGHKVSIYEKASMSHEIGQGITLAANGGRILRDLGLDFEKNKIADYLGSTTVSAETLEEMAPMVDLSDYHNKFGINLKSASRIDLHAALVDLARSQDGAGPPAEIHPHAGVASFDGDNGAIILESGETVRGDLIIAADGVKSHAAMHINGPSCPELESSGTIVYRFAIPAKKLRSDPETTHLLDAGDGIGSFNVASRGDRWLVRYYCSGYDVSNFALYELRTIEDAEHQETELRFKSDRSAILEEMKGFHPSLLKVVNMADDVLPLWRCTTREPLQKLHRGRMVVIGDAAHPVFPHLGLGAVSAIEDGGFLGRLFRNMPSSGDVGELVEQRLTIFSKYRVPRVAAYKYYSDVPFFRKVAEENRDKIEKFWKPEDLPRDRAEVHAFYMSYEAPKEAEQALKEAGLE